MSSPRSTAAVCADLNRVICSYDPCPIIVGDIMMWRDKGHITATYARELAPAMRRLLEGVLSSS